MIYLFDKKQTLTGVIDEYTQALSATFEMKINEASTLDFALPLDDELSNKMSGVKYVGVPSPNNADKIVFLRLMTINDETDRVEYMAKELAYQELSSSGYIEDKRPTESDAQTLMNIALDGSGYRLGVVNVPGNVKTNFYYTDHLSAVSNVVGLLGGEIYFYVSLTGSKITGRYMDYVVSQGTNTSKTFADGSNLITAERKRDMSSVYTAILPRGKGEQTSNGEGDTPDGYGRRIDISGVEWNKAKGNPLDKKAGDKILVDPEATAEYGNADGTPRLLLKTYDDIEDANVLISKAYTDLMAINKPAVQYSATVANVGDMQLGDTIVIMHSKRSMSYRTRVFHITYDLIDNTKTVAEFGNDFSKESITNQINSISSNGATISDQVQWNISNGGHDNTSYGAQEPANPRKGDVWFKQLPNGSTEQYYFDGTVWVLGAKTDQQWQENQAIAQGTHTTFYGIAVPAGAVKGDVWFKTDNNVPDGKSMYTYDGNSWIKFDGSADASRLQIGTIDASKINVMNLSANDIVTGTLSANFLKGGQIDASKINVINMSANNISTGTLDAVKVKIAGKDSSIDMADGGITFNPATGDAWKTIIDRHGMDIQIKNKSRTTLGNNSITMYDDADGYYRLGGLLTLKNKGDGENVHTSGVYLSLDEWQTTKNGDKYWNYGGEDFFGGSEIGIAHSTGVDDRGNPVYGALMKWSNGLAASRDNDISKGFNFFDDINFHDGKIQVTGTPDKFQWTWVSWSDWGNRPTIALANQNASAGIAVNEDNLVLFASGKRADATTGWKA